MKNTNLIVGLVVPVLLTAVGVSAAPQDLQGILDSITRNPRGQPKMADPAPAPAPERPDPIRSAPVTVPAVPVRTASRAPKRNPMPNALAEIVSDRSDPSPIKGPAPAPTPATMSAEDVARIQAVIAADMVVQRERAPVAAPAEARARPLEERPQVVEAIPLVPAEQVVAEGTPEKASFLGRLFGRKGPEEEAANGEHPNASLVTTGVPSREAEPTPASRAGESVELPVRPAVRANRQALKDLVAGSRGAAEVASAAKEGAATRGAPPTGGPSAYRYQGEWHQGQMHGYGKLTYGDGWEYVGAWVNGSMEGQGRLVQPDGSIYEGGWKAGQMHGLGKLTYADGWTFTGQWRDGHISGQGELVHPGS